MHQTRVHFLHLGSPDAVTTAVMQFRSLASKGWIVTGSTFQHIPRENDHTIQEALDQADILISMGKHTFNELEKRFVFDARKMLVWEESDSRPERLQAAVKRLVVYLLEGPWVDVTDAAGNNAGLRLPIGWVSDRGYWHAGIHVILLTSSGSVVLEIHSKDIFFSPGAVGVTLGGFVGTGETPEYAALREIKEGIGLHLGLEDLTLLDVRQRSAWHPRHRKLSRSIVHAYLVVIDDSNMILRPEFSEVAGLAVCTPRQLHDLLLGKRVEGIGRITSSHAYYRDIVRLAKQKLKQSHTSRRSKQKTVQ